MKLYEDNPHVLPFLWSFDLYDEDSDTNSFYYRLNYRAYVQRIDGEWDYVEYAQDLILQDNTYQFQDLYVTCIYKDGIEEDTPVLVGYNFHTECYVEDYLVKGGISPYLYEKIAAYVESEPLLFMDKPLEAIEKGCIQKIVDCIANKDKYVEVDTLLGKVVHAANTHQGYAILPTPEENADLIENLFRKQGVSDNVPETVLQDEI